MAPIWPAKASALVRFRVVEATVVCRAYTLRTFPDRYQLQPQRGAATEDKSECVSRQRLNANDFRMILAENDTEKLGGYQEKNKDGTGTDPERDDPR